MSERAQVAEQASNTGILNTEPAIVRGTVVGIVSAIGSILVIGGWLGEDQKNALAEQVGIVVPGLLTIAGIVAGIWTRAGVWSPKTAAKIAVVNTNEAFAAGMEGAKKPIPTLIPPP